MTDEIAKCAVCGEPMPEGETMFKFHGYSGPCPKPPLPQPDPVELARADARMFGNGFYRRYPDGRLEHIPADQVTICIGPNTQED